MLLWKLKVVMNMLLSLSAPVDLCFYSSFYYYSVTLFLCADWVSDWLTDWLMKCAGGHINTHTHIHTHAHTLSLHCLDARLMCNPPSQPSITVNLATEASQLLLSKTWALLFHPQYFIHLLLQGHGCPPHLSPPFPHINIHSTHTHTSLSSHSQ